MEYLYNAILHSHQNLLKIFNKIVKWLFLFYKNKRKLVVYVYRKTTEKIYTKIKTFIMTELVDCR